MQQPFGQLQAPLHAAGKGFGALVGALGQPHPAQHLRDALLQRRPAQSVEVADVAQVLGIFTSEPGGYLERIKSRRVADLAISAEEIERLIAERALARKAKDFKRSDEIRDLLLARNIALLDSPTGTTWAS